MKHDARTKADQAKAIATKLKMEPIPTEGGYFAGQFRSPDQIESPQRFGGGPRIVVSTIYFLLYRDFNTMHRMRNNEIWCWHGGGTLTLYEIKPDGTLITHKLGDPLAAPENKPQVVIEAFSWMAAELENADDWVLVTCCVAPGFELSDYEFADRAKMSADYPAHAALFKRMIRVKPGSSATDLDYHSPPL